MPGTIQKRAQLGLDDNLSSRQLDGKKKEFMRAWSMTILAPP